VDELGRLLESNDSAEEIETTGLREVDYSAYVQEQQ